MGDFLRALLSLSLGGGLAALLPAALPRLKRVRIDAGWRRFVWILLLARLAVPIPLGLPALIRLPLALEWEPSVGATSAAPSESAENGQTSQGVGAASGEAPPAAGSGNAGGVRDLRPVSLSTVLFILWAAGAAGMGLWMLMRHLRFTRFLRRWAEPEEEPETLARYASLADELGLRRQPRLLRCPGLRAPVLAGVWRSVLLLPREQLTEKELRYTLLHELTHYRRHDLLIRTLTLWVNALHWFNPLIWAAAGWAQRDMELACDRRVLLILPPEERADYGRTLLELSMDIK